MMWILIMVVVLAAFIAGFAYLTSRFCKYQIVKRISKDRKGLKILISMLPIVAMEIIAWITMGNINAIIIFLHLVVIWMIFELMQYIIQKIRKKNFKRYYAGIFAITFTVVYLCVGWYLAHNVWRTSYTVKTEKNIGNLRVVLFSDSHVGTTFDGTGWKEYVDRMNNENPDIVLIAGDFVDDDTSREDMILSCRAMRDLKTKYGVYFVFGNHDKGYYNETYRGYNGDDLVAELQKNNVTVLQDEKVLIDDRFYIIGRQDRSEDLGGGNKERATMTSLMEGIDLNKYVIVMDHQPHDYENEASVKSDLVLSGHTHGGQLLPINHVGEWIGENAKAYGWEKRDNTNFIVTSGISDWAIKFKTGCKSEYVVIDVEN